MLARTGSVRNCVRCLFAFSPCPPGQHLPPLFRPEPFGREKIRRHQKPPVLWDKIKHRVPDTPYPGCGVSFLNTGRARSERRPQRTNAPTTRRVVCARTTNMKKEHSPFNLRSLVKLRLIPLTYVWYLLGLVFGATAPPRPHKPWQCRPCTAS